MEVPGSWESRGLEDFDGVVWFTRTVEWPAKVPRGRSRWAASATPLEVWVNGQPLARPPAAPGGWRAPVVFTLPDGVLKAGVNTITVRIGNFRREGGFLDSPAGMYVEGGEKLPLAGTWQYRVERQTNAAALYGRPGELAAHVAAAAAAESGERGLTVAEPTPRSAGGRRVEARRHSPSAEVRQD